MGPKAIVRAIDLLPVLDLTWPDEWQTTWWHCVEFLFEEIRRIERPTG